MIYYEVSNSTSLPFLVASKRRQASAVLNCTSECMLIVQILSYDACMMLVVVRPLKLPAGSSYATFKGLWFCYLCYRVCPASLDMWTHRSRLLLEPLEGSQLKPVLLSQRPEFFEQRELEDLQILFGDFFACDSCTNWIVSKCFNDSLMIPRATA